MIPAAERVILVGLEHDGVSRWDLEDSLDELRQLADTAGAKVVETVVQRLDKPTAPFYIGKGKAGEIAKSSGEKHATSVIFDDELSPAQSRNLEELTNRKVIDRTQLILDIFASRARTREGRLQIELAQLQYLLPRLTGMWSHLSRQTGGIGTRFPGSVAVSARTGEGIPKLIEELEIRLAAWRMQGRFEIPLTEQALIAEVHRVGHVLDLKYGEASAIISAHIPPELIGRLTKFDAGPPEK